MSWDDYRYFLSIVRHQTLKAAARELGVDQATVGRRLMALQESLGTQLLEKSSDGYFPTAAGSRILKNVEAMEEGILSIDRAISGADERLAGTVKIAMPGALANDALFQSLRPVLRQHPELELQFLTGSEVLNLSRREADLAIRLVRPQQKDLKTKKVGTIRLGLYASEELALKYPNNWEEAPFVGLFNRAMSELERSFLRSLKFEPRCCVRSSTWGSVASAVQAGLGLGILPTFYGGLEKSLRLLKEDRAETPLWLVVHPEVAESARVRLVIDHLTKFLAHLR